MAREERKTKRYFDIDFLQALLNLGLFRVTRCKQEKQLLMIRYLFRPCKAVKDFRNFRNYKHNVFLFITRNTRISFRKAHLQKSICYIFTCEKSLYSQSKWRTAVFTCGQLTDQRQRKGLFQPIRIVHRLHSNSVSDFGGFFYQHLLQIFLRRRRKTLDQCQLVAAETGLCGIKKTRTHQANHREMSHCSKKNYFQGTG